VYRAFDERQGADGFAEREAALRSALTAPDLARLPSNDLASSPLAAELTDLGAFRADVTGAGPAVYGLFESEERAREAASALAHAGSVLLSRPVAAA